MSWDAWLTDDRGHSEGDWSYTHNCNPMANSVLDPEERLLATKRWWTNHGRPEVAEQQNLGDGSWWQCLDGLTGPEGAALLDRIIRGLEADPERFQAMNPPNGWGDYDSLVRVLKDMRDRVPEWPCTWETSG